MSQHLAVATRPISHNVGHAPYLVADAHIFHHDQIKRQWYKQQWISQCPKIENTLHGKMAWMASIGSSYAYEQARMNWFVPSPKDVASQVFFELAPPSLEIELYCMKSDLSSISIGDSRQFASLCRKFIQQAYNGHPTWSDYMKWLTALDTDSVLLASISCKKTDRLQDKIAELADSLSIDASLDGYCVMSSEMFASNASLSWWSLMAAAGENLYYPSPTSRCAVPVQAYFSLPKLNRLSNSDLLGKLNRKSRYSREAAGTHLDFMVVPKDGRDISVLGSIEKAKLEENFDILWLACGFKQQVQRIADHFSGNGETIDFQVFMHRGPSETATALLMICEAEVSFLETFGRKNEQLVAAMALIVSFSDISPLWIRCKATRKEAAAVVKNLGDIWRLQILSAKDENLGIDKKTRLVIYRALKLRAQIFACSGLAFDWEPAVKGGAFEPKSKRNTSPDSVVVDEIVNEVLRTMHSV